MSFGKKGVVPGQNGAMRPTAQAAGARPAAPIRPAAPDPYAAQREAFLAAERARRASAPDEREREQVSLPYPSPQPRAGGWGMFGDPAKRSLILAYVYWHFCSPLGLHRMYCGAKDTAYCQMALFFGGLVLLAFWPPLGIASMVAWLLWILADLVLMPGLMRRFKAQHRTDYREIFA